MADILIRDLPLPREGESDYHITIKADGKVEVRQQVGREQAWRFIRKINRTAQELPPHGELVQRSDIIGLFDENNLSARKAVMKAPTIVPASKEK